MNTSHDEIIELKKQMGLPLDKKIILYAPTWRDNSYVTQGYTFKLEVDFKKLQEALGEDYVVIFKPHYLIINDFNIFKRDSMFTNIPSAITGITNKSLFPTRFHSIIIRPFMPPQVICFHWDFTSNNGFHPI